MTNIFQELQKRGYQVYHKRILGNPLYTSKEIRRKDLIQELALVVEFLRVNLNIEIWLRPERNCNEGITKYYYGIDTISSTNHLKIINVKDDFNGNYLTPQEATIAAIEYLIENKLI